MSEMELRACAQCFRHARSTERACPFCGAVDALRGEVPAPGSSARVAFAAALALSAGLSLGACYGAPPHPQPYRPPPPNQERPAPPASPTQQPLEPVPTNPTPAR